MMEIRPFKIAVPDAALDDLYRRLDATRWPAQETVPDWSQGTPTAFMRALCEHWRHHYDWRRCEAALNALGSHKACIDGLDFHFLHIRSPEPGAVPMVMTHGWPGSLIEFMKVIGPLTDPVRHGGRAEDAFHLVLPSLPGYGFSAQPTESGWTVQRIADAWTRLMGALGYDHFVAQGGDWGAIVTTMLGRQSPDVCQGIHINMVVLTPTAQELAEANAEEQLALAGMATFADRGMGYAKLQGTRPQSLGYGLADSPVGQAAWVIEKFCAWSDCDGDPLSIFTMDELLDNIMQYWLNNAGASAARLYWESTGVGARAHVTPLPSACTIFPKELFQPSRRWTESRYTGLQYWSVAERGGHFAAMEQPALFVNEVRQAFGTLLRRDVSCRVPS